MADRPVTVTIYHDGQDEKVVEIVKALAHAGFEVKQVRARGLDEPVLVGEFGSVRGFNEIRIVVNQLRAIFSRSKRRGV
ncbi:MAG: hypothetical protein ABWW70_07450 [Thermoproteota archaeon]